MHHSLPSQPDGSDLRIAILHTRWYSEVVDGLRQGARESLASHGVSDQNILEIEIPGAFELPLAASWVARGQDVDAVLALGCIVRGETPHFDFVASACTDGLAKVALDNGLPIGLGVITADSKAQALARCARSNGDADGKTGNKGAEAADAAVRMASTYRALENRRST